jgi:hypothetical protein
MRKKVTVKRGNGNYYKVIGDSKLEVYCTKTGFISNSSNSIGSVRSLEDAISLIRSHSGSEVASIQDL